MKLVRYARNLAEPLLSGNSFLTAVSRDILGLLYIDKMKEKHHNEKCS